MNTTDKIKLGILGMSQGNGHPYSWSAIFNGFDSAYMRDCPFPVIFEYLSKQTFPEDAIFDATISHIWTQERSISEHIAKASNIPHIVENFEDLIGKTDAILLARDDSENHYLMSKPFLEAGLPIFIDKPLSTSVKDAKKILDLQKYKGQLFTCSSLRYAKEFQLTEEEKNSLGRIKFIDATIPKSWEKYAVHIIEPVLNILPHMGKPRQVINTGQGEINITTVNWNELSVVFKVLGDSQCPLSIRIFGSKSHKELIFKDTFYAFKTSLIHFIKSVKERTVIIPERDTLNVIEIIERGIFKSA